ncbi:MAG: hypothetical protein ACYTBZ_30045, partial [Planctomycetota bacterium]
VENEILTVDTKNKRVFTKFKENAFNFLDPSSEFGNFVLLPGINRIKLLVLEGVEAQAQIKYTPLHWSVDSIGIK